MRHTFHSSFAIALASLASFASFSSGVAFAQDARLTVLHGVPGLPQPVAVVANGTPLFTFDYREQRGPLTLPAGSYAIEVRLGGTPILSTTLVLNAAIDYSVLAHLDAAGTPRLSAFTNDRSALALPQSRLTVRHLAKAPAVDVALEQNGTRIATIPALANGGTVTTNVAPGEYDASLFVAGTTTRAFGPVRLALENGVAYAVHAVGDVAAPSFGLLVQRQSLTARVTVIHGIPALPSPVDVFAGAARLFAFDFGELRGPLVLNPGAYPLSVQLNGTPVLAANATVAAGDDVTVVAHLDAGGTPRLSSFPNDVSPLASGARLTVRHLAKAPAVDLALDSAGARVLTLPAVVNGQGATVPIGASLFFATVFPAGGTSAAFGPAPLKTATGVHSLVHAVGDLAAGTFRFVVQTIDVRDAVAGNLVGVVGGASCGPRIGVVPASFAYGEEFAVTIARGPSNGMAVFNIGNDAAQAGALTLPFALGGIGAPGCFLLTNVLATHPLMLDATGAARVGFLVPRAAFGGFPEAFVQFVAVDRAANALGVVTTDLLTIRAN